MSSPEAPHERRPLVLFGATGQVGRVTGGRLIQAKGRTYSLRDLLDEDGQWERFEGGAFVTLYLSPKDYHRIHAPTDGGIARARHVPGALMPVNVGAVMHVPDLFARNERLLCYLDGPLGRVAVVADVERTFGLVRQLAILAGAACQVEPFRGAAEARIWLGWDG